jgi:ubiquinone/menaquinone biosynthesis C-methylase UbiE
MSAREAADREPADDFVKRQVAAHWNRRAPHFDEDFGHSIRTSAERAAWERIFDLVLAPGRTLDALDVGCGTGFLTFELAARGHRVTGVDFAVAMLDEALRKATQRNVSVRLQQADAEELPFTSRSFDLVTSRHLLWTLANPEAAINEWIRIIRPGGRLVVVDGQFDPTTAPPLSENARSSREYAEVGAKLPFLYGRSREEIENLLKGHGLVNVASDPLLDLVAAQQQRMTEEGREPRMRQRYAVWGDAER